MWWLYCNLIKIKNIKKFPNLNQLQFLVRPDSLLITTIILVTVRARVHVRMSECVHDDVFGCELSVRGVHGFNRKKRKKEIYSIPF